MIILLGVCLGAFLLVVFRPLAVSRLMVGLGGAVSVGLAIVLSVLLEPPRGDLSGGLSPVPLVVSTAIAVFVGGLVTAVLSDPPTRAHTPPPRAPIELNSSSRVVWFSTAYSTGRTRALLILGALTGFAFTGLNLSAGHFPGALLSLLGGLGLISFTKVTVRVDAHGVHWKLMPGLPRGFIPHEDITRVRARDIRPGDWGGRGWRFNHLGQAVLIRDGEGLQIQRGKKNLFITVDDAARGAALIEAYRQR